MNKLNSSTPITNCQVCSSDQLDSVIFLGFHPPVNDFKEIGSTAGEQSTFPLELLRCGVCSLVQIGSDVDPALLFPPNYPYLSGSTTLLRDNFKALEREVTKSLELAKEDLIVDFGSNDGTLLENFKNAGYRVLGVEPSKAAEVANKKGIETLMQFFGENSARDIRERYGAAKVLTAANVFAHIRDVHQVVRGVKTLLDTGGVFISENHYLPSLVSTCQYDTVYHEHLRYYTVKSLQHLFAMHQMEIFHVSKIPTHGGSIRVYAAKEGERDISDSVDEVLEAENSSGFSDGSALMSFNSQVVQSKLQLMALLSTLKKKGCRVYGIGAPSRAATLINYCGLDDQIIDCIVEISTSKKLNQYMPGTRIPVIDEKTLLQDQPDYALLLSWHLKEGLMKSIRAKGYEGQFICPLPIPHIINSEGA